MKVSGVVVVVALGAASCTRPNPSFCDEAADCANGQVCDLQTNSCSPLADDANTSTSCSINDECTAATTPICGEGGVCRACVLDDECASRVCNEDGSCEAEADVLYVAVDGLAAGQCGPTSTCDLVYARSLVTATRRTIRLANGSYSLASDFVVSVPISDLRIVGSRAAVIGRSTTGPSFDVRDGAKLTVRGISLSRGVQCTTASVTLTRVAFDSTDTDVRPWLAASNCTSIVTESELLDSLSDGITAAYSGTLEVSKTVIENSAVNGIKATGLTQVSISESTLRRNVQIGLVASAAGSQQVALRRSLFTANRRGGASITGGVFDVTNNFIYRNGNDGDGNFGGLRLDTNTTGNRVEHNTIVRNDAQVDTNSLQAGGLFCKGGGSAANNLIANNFTGNNFQPTSQINGTCSTSGSIIQADDSTLRFVRPGAEPFDYHLLDAQSPAVNAGVTVASPVTVDHDGTPRADAMPDVGADEL